MVNPLALLGALPKLDGFAPLPIATMIPFMEAQSASLAYSFGLNYEYGKRKVKSMSNEEFNALTPEQITAMANNHTSVQMDALAKKIPQSMGLQKVIMEMHKEIELEKVDMNISLMRQLPSAYFDAIFDISEKADGAVRNPVSEGSPTAGRSPGSSRTGSDQGSKNILPDRPPQGSGSRNPGSSRNPTPQKSQNEILSENQAFRIWENVKTIQSEIDALRKDIANPSTNVGRKQRLQSTLTNKVNKVNAEIKIINAIQQSHKRNFGKYIVLK